MIVWWAHRLNMMVKAVDLILEASRQGKDPKTLWPQTPRRLHPHGLPAPMACDLRPELCHAEEPGAYINFETSE